MNYDREKVDEIVVALLYLTITEQNDWGARTWKSHDWDALDRLHARGSISDPKSVVLSPEGLDLARRLPDLDPYEILATIGAGGMGEVYRARDPRIGWLPKFYEAVSRIAWMRES